MTYNKELTKNYLFAQHCEQQVLDRWTITHHRISRQGWNRTESTHPSPSAIHMRIQAGLFIQNEDKLISDAASFFQSGTTGISCCALTTLSQTNRSCRVLLVLTFSHYSRSSSKQTVFVTMSHIDISHRPFCFLSFLNLITLLCKNIFPDIVRTSKN